MSDSFSAGFENLFKPEFVIDNLEAHTRIEALAHMSSFLVNKGHCRPSFVDGILKRESLYPSGLPMAGPKIAIPHTDSEHVIESVILFARLREPVEFLSMGNPEEKLSVKMISMFALKEKKSVGNLLETLIGVYQQEELLNAILEARGSSEIYAMLAKAVQG